MLQSLPPFLITGNLPTLQKEGWGLTFPKHLKHTQREGGGDFARQKEDQISQHEGISSCPTAVLRESYVQVHPFTSKQGLFYYYYFMKHADGRKRRLCPTASYLAMWNNYLQDSRCAATKTAAYQISQLNTAEHTHFKYSTLSSSRWSPLPSCCPQFVWREPCYKRCGQNKSKLEDRG